jgi:hypothetical protein
MKRNVLLALLALPFFSFAQYEFYNKGADITIQNGALVHVQGSFTNDNDVANGAVSNEGILEVKGNFENKTGSSFTGSSSEAAVKFVGSGKQAIKGSLNTPGTASLYNLVLSQPSAADSVELQTNVAVEGSVIFGASNISLTYSPNFVYTNNGSNSILKTYDSSNEYVLNIMNGSTDAIVGYPTLVMNSNPATGFIVTKGTRGSAGGGMQRRVTNSTTYDFPVGTVENGYNAVRLNFSSIPGSGGDVKAKFCDSTTSARGYVGTISQHCVGCTPSNPTPDNPGYNRYFSQNSCNGNQPQWLILEESGVLEHGYWSFDATDNGLGQWKYVIEVFPNSFIAEGSSDDTWRTIKYRDSNGDFGFDPSDFTVDWRPQLENVDNISDLLTYTRNAGCYSGSGVPGGVYTDFSHFSMHKSNSGNALPVELIYLKAEPVQNEFIQVSWATAIEINNDGFEVLRSTDGINYTNIGWVEGNDNSSVVQTYSFDDHTVAANVVYYYKLRQVDNDGASEETYVVSAMITNSETFVVSDFMPNPTRDASKIVITTSKAQTIQVKMFDLIGQIITDTYFELTPGNNSIVFDGQNFADGTYTAAIYANDKVYSKKLVVTK